MMSVMGVVALFPTIVFAISGNYIPSLICGILSLICFIDYFANLQEGEK